MQLHGHSDCSDAITFAGSTESAEDRPVAAAVLEFELVPAEGAGGAGSADEALQGIPGSEENFRPTPQAETTVCSPLTHHTDQLPGMSLLLRWQHLILNESELSSSGLQ